MRIYAKREDDGRSVLVAIRCDNCDTEIRPHPEISTSGWVKVGSDDGIGTPKFYQHLCQPCALAKED